jgi:hypothetical protein
MFSKSNYQRLEYWVEASIGTWSAKNQKMKKTGWILVLVILILLTSGFVWTFFTRLALPYNEEGRYLDEAHMTVYNQQAVGVYGLFAGIGIVLMALILIVQRNRRCMRIKG